MNMHHSMLSISGRITLLALMTLSSIVCVNAETSLDFPILGHAIHRPGPVGQHGWGATDLDGDGRSELVTSSNGPAALILVYGRLAGTSALGLKQDLLGPPGSITALATAQTGDTRVIAVSPDMTVTRYGGWPLTPIGSFTVAHATTLARIGDIDADGTLELLCAGDGKLSAYSLPEGTLKWSMTLQVKDMVLASLDTDPALEIIIAGGDSAPGVVLDGATLMMDWTRPEGFGTYLAAGAFGDALESGFVSAWDWGGFAGYSAAPYASIWSTDEFDIDGVAAGDTDADGRDEFAVGDGQWGAIRVYDAPSRQMLYSMDNPSWGIWSLGMLDFDADSRDEVWYSARIEQSSDFDESFAAAIMNPITARPRLTIESYRQGATASLLADFDQDGQYELAVGTSNPGAYTGFLRVLDATTLDEIRRAPLRPGSSFQPYQITYRSIHAAQLDDDPALEMIIVGAKGQQESRIRIVDGGTWAVDRQIPEPGTGAVLFSSITTSRLVQHVPGGPPELLVASYRYASPDNVWLDVYSLPAGELLWSSSTVGGMYDRSLGIDVGNLDADPSPEYLLVHTQGLTAFDAHTGQTEWTLPVETQGAIIVAKPERPEIFSCTPRGDVTRYDPAPLVAVGGFSLPEPLERLARLPGKDDWLLAVAGERLLLIDLDGNVLRQSSWIGSGPGVGDNLDVVRNGNSWLVSIGRSFATFQMRIVEADQIFEHGFE